MVPRNSIRVVWFLLSTERVQSMGKPEILIGAPSWNLSICFYIGFSVDITTERAVFLNLLLLAFPKRWAYYVLSGHFLIGGPILHQVCNSACATGIPSFSYYLQLLISNDTISANCFNSSSSTQQFCPHKCVCVFFTLWIMMGGMFY